MCTTCIDPSTCIDLCLVKHFTVKVMIASSNARIPIPEDMQTFVSSILCVSKHRAPVFSIEVIGATITCQERYRQRHSTLSGLKGFIYTTNHSIHLMKYISTGGLKISHLLYLSMVKIFHVFIVHCVTPLVNFLTTKISQAMVGYKSSCHLEILQYQTHEIPKHLLLLGSQNQQISVIKTKLITIMYILSMSKAD